MAKRLHDAWFKSAFEAPADAAVLVRDLLPSAVSTAIEWSSLERARGSFVDAVLADRHSDLLFVARLRIGEPSLAYVLLEHQSTGDPEMPRRILTYKLRSWDQFRKDHPLAPLPPVIVVLVSHAPGGWNAPCSFEAMFDPRVLAIPGLAELSPRFSFLVDDLARQSNEDLKARSLAAFHKVALWLLRDGRNPTRLLDNFSSWMPELIEVKRSRASDFETLLSYLFGVVDATSLDDVRAKLRGLESHREEDTMTIAEMFEERGRVRGHAEGRARGHAEARLAILRDQLLLKFKKLDAAYEARLCAATAEAIDRYLERVLFAGSLAAVFED